MIIYTYARIITTGSFITSVIPAALKPLIARLCFAVSTGVALQAISHLMVSLLTS